MKALAFIFATVDAVAIIGSLHYLTVQAEQWEQRTEHVVIEQAGCYTEDC